MNMTHKLKPEILKINKLNLNVLNSNKLNFNSIIGIVLCLGFNKS